MHAYIHFSIKVSIMHAYIHFSIKVSITTKTMNVGLPQGAVSSPWLFSICVNNMHAASDKLTFRHFATILLCI